MDERQARNLLSRIASTCRFALSEDEGDRLYERFSDSYKEISDLIDAIADPTLTTARVGKHHPASYYIYIRELKGLEQAWKRLAKSIEMAQFVNAGKKLVKYIIQYKSIPKGNARKVQRAAEVFMKMRRMPRKLDTWWKRNAKHIQTILGSRGWPLKTVDEGEEIYNLGPFEVHNTLALSDRDLSKTNKAIESAAKFLSSSRIPKARQVLYGPVMIVGRLQQPRTLAWYYPSDDTIYLRVHRKVSKGEVHNLIHEIGHRYWKKLLSPLQKKAWKKHHRQMKGLGESEEGELDEFNQREIQKLNELEVGDEFPIKLKGMIRGGPPRIVDIIQSGDAYQWVVTNRKGTRRARVSRSAIINNMKENNRRRKAVDHFPTVYASTDPEEHFCEAFAMYAMNKLPVEHKEAFETIIG